MFVANESKIVIHLSAKEALELRDALGRLPSSEDVSEDLYVALREIFAQDERVGG